MAEYALPGIFVMGCLVYLMESYVIRCPEQAEWNIRAEILCQNTTTYFCLYNYITYSYEEGCTGPDWDRPGSKRVYARNFNRAPCRYTRYQPIKFVTGGNSDCIFRKSLCTNEGQTLFEAGTTKTDSTCRCDYKRGYTFVTVPRNKCSCRPSEEDCSCYLKKCQGIGYNLSADYECTKNGTKKTVCPLMSENPSEDPHIDMTPTGTLREDDSYAIRGKWVVFIVVLCTLIGMIVSTVITMCIMLRQRLPRSRRLSTKQTVEGPIESGRLDTINQNATTDKQAVEGPIESGRLDTINQNATTDKQAWKDEMELPEKSLSLQFIDQNATNDEQAHIESGRMDAGPSLDTIDQNATNDESVGNAESKKMETGPSLNTIDQNVTNDQPDGIRLEETVSRNNEHDQIALREDDKKRKYALETFIVRMKKEGPGAELDQFKEDLENWRNEPVKLAVTGKSGVGKSSFINAIRNLKSGVQGFAATSSSGNTTKHATVYEYPGNPNITLHDLPGFGTTCSENEYKEIMGLSKYDCFLIFVSNIERNDIEIAKILKAMKKPFCFVRSKLDFDFQNAKNDRDLEADVIKNIKASSLDILKNTEFKETKFFVISNCNQSIGQFNELVLCIQSSLPELKCTVVKLYMCGELSADIIDSKYELLKRRSLKVSEASICLDTQPICNMDRLSNMKLISKELLLYRKAFGFEQQFVKDILKDDDIRRNLNASSIVEIQPADEAMDNFVQKTFSKLKTSEARKSPNDLTVPSVVSVLPDKINTFKLLNQVLNGCRDDARLLYLHEIAHDLRMVGFYMKKIKSSQARYVPNMNTTSGNTPLKSKED